VKLKKKQSDENLDEINASNQSAEESFGINYFLSIIDQAISSVTTGLEQYQGYPKKFWFLIYFYHIIVIG
jgi:hypothetical protein